MYNPDKNKTLFMYIFLASFRSQERANNHNDKGDKNVNKQLVLRAKTTILFTHHTSLMSIARWEVLESEFSFVFLNLDAVLKNSTPGKLAFIF